MNHHQLSRLALARKYIPSPFFWLDTNIKRKSVAFKNFTHQPLPPLNKTTIPLYPSPSETKRGTYVFRCGQLHKRRTHSQSHSCMCNSTMSSKTASACCLISHQSATQVRPRCQSGSCWSICQSRWAWHALKMPRLQQVNLF